jgi:predicted esterase
MRLAVGTLSLWCALATAQGPGQPPALDAARRKAVEALANDWFKARPATRFDDWDEAARKALLARAQALDPLPDAAVAEVRAILWKAARAHGPKLDDRQKIATRWGKAGYAVENEHGAGPQTGLLIGLHGGGEGAGDKGEAIGSWSSFLQKNKLVGVFPQAIQLVHDAWCTAEGERFVLTLIEMSKRTYDLDPDRVFAAGFSMGGTGTWWLCGRWPQQFAGGMPFHGVLFNDAQQTDHESRITSVQHGLMPNVRHVPLYYTTGTDDRNCIPYSYEFAAPLLDALRKAHPGDYEIQYRCVPGLAHAFAPGEPAAACKWILGRRRTAVPKTVTWEALVDPGFPKSDGRVRVTGCYWLRCDTPVERMLVEAEVQGQNVTLQVQRHDPTGFVVYLSSALVDVGRPVTIT